MKRSISLSELRESLGEDVIVSSPTASSSGTMRRARSYDNFTSLTPRSGASTPPVTGGKVPMLSEKELREHFNMPLNEVAKKFGMCTTALKKLCRKYGVMQWPHRKLRSLEKKIASLRAEQRYTTDGHGTLDDEIRKLEQQREALITGNGEAMDDNWSPNQGDADDDGLETEQLISGYATPTNLDAKKLEARILAREALITGNGEAMDDNWSPNQGDADDDGLETEQLISGYATPTNLDAKKLEARILSGHVSKEMPKPSFPRTGSGHSKPLGPGGSSSPADVHNKTLAEENASLRALSRALMTERQELMSKLSASSAEVANLRNLCNQLQSQVLMLDRNRGGEEGLDMNGFKTEPQDEFSSNGMHEDNFHDSHRRDDGDAKYFPGRGHAQVHANHGGLQHGREVLSMDHGDNGDMNSLAWMAPDFELEDLL
eukprot:CAMPEP_0202853162 /NCGR_PEP_ID=MMETSP1389-20130828/90338_1 /ASSEMBLY_ACC=CAM_ASM_000865 /TAXON_ID=302021 /ORGANISM="Rhodomonas sp., Strain CCMP768" /LENGTH=431 /DNA_ID=CAMNT_0049531705 /DNA_START=807 /DNA_END=2103 /DNA_ORIENTATION=-